MRKNSTVRHVLCRTVESRFGVWEAFCARIRESLLKALVEKRRRKRRNVENGGRFLDTERQIYLVIFRIIALQKRRIVPWNADFGGRISVHQFLYGFPFSVSGIQRNVVFKLDAPHYRFCVRKRIRAVGRDTRMLWGA